MNAVAARLVTLWGPQTFENNLPLHCPPIPKAAAGWLIEQDVEAEEQAWQRAREEAREAAQLAALERQRSKAAVLNRFDLRPVSGPAEGGKKERPLEAWTAGKQQQQQQPGKVRGLRGLRKRRGSYPWAVGLPCMQAASCAPALGTRTTRRVADCAPAPPPPAQPQVRYREGVAVTSRGEKYVVDRPPDWDGGSRGKVGGRGVEGECGETTRTAPGACDGRAASQSRSALPSARRSPCPRTQVYTKGKRGKGVV